MSCITLTAGEVCENGEIGVKATVGFTSEELAAYYYALEKIGVKVEWYDLVQAGDVKGSPASVLIIRNGVDYLTGAGSADAIYREQEALNWDRKAFMYGRAVNKKARHNLCYVNGRSQEPDYAKKQGRIYDIKTLPYTDQLHQKLSLFGEKAQSLQLEGNRYYDIKKCGIGFHGDTERSIVIGVRFGSAIPLHFQWYHRSQPVGRRIILLPNHGDIYIMSEKSVGSDWKKSSILTLRHAAGTTNFLYPK